MSYGESEIFLPKLPDYGSGAALVDHINNRVKDSIYGLEGEELDLVIEAWNNAFNAINELLNYPLDKDAIFTLSSVCDYIDNLNKEQLTVEDIEGMIIVATDVNKPPVETLPGRYVERIKDDMRVLRFIPDGYFDDFSDEELANMHIKIFNTLLVTPKLQRRAAYEQLSLAQ